jgi:hypothetical protein
MTHPIHYPGVIRQTTSKIRCQTENFFTSDDWFNDIVVPLFFPNIMLSLSLYCHMFSAAKVGVFLRLVNARARRKIQNPQMFKTDPESFFPAIHIRHIFTIIRIFSQKLFEYCLPYQSFFTLQKSSQSQDFKTLQKLVLDRKIRCLWFLRMFWALYHFI